MCEIKTGHDTLRSTRIRIQIDEHTHTHFQQDSLTQATEARAKMALRTDDADDDSHQELD